MNLHAPSGFLLEENHQVLLHLMASECEDGAAYSMRLKIMFTVSRATYMFLCAQKATHKHDLKCRPEIKLSDNLVWKCWQRSPRNLPAGFK